MSKPTIANERPCPRCKKGADVSPENKSRPFCSERCQLLDLSQWLEGEYRIPGDPVGIDQSE